jgi:hypothetical protein
VRIQQIITFMRRVVDEQKLAFAFEIEERFLSAQADRFIRMNRKNKIVGMLRLK